MQYPSFGNDGFQNFKDIFNALLLTGKDKIDDTLARYPQDLLSATVESLYDTLNNRSAGASFSGGLPDGLFNEEKLTHLIDGLKGQMQKPLVSKLLAKQLKKTLDSKSNEDLGAMIEKMAGGRSLDDQMMIQMMLIQLSPMFDALRAASTDEVAEQIRGLADQLPSDMIAQQLMQLAQEKAAASTPKKDLTQTLPAPDAVADTFHKLGHAASNALGAAASNDDFAAKAHILKQFSESARHIVATGLGKGPKKGPGGHRFHI